MSKQDTSQLAKNRLVIEQSGDELDVALRLNLRIAPETRRMLNLAIIVVVALLLTLNGNPVLAQAILHLLSLAK
jgi:hypothetical protein